ncbi:hypothetical protein ACFOZ5_00990 [Marinobacter lacisalsi]|uniref:Uncharacterized protein n=1 Tax=Marinobacter lacisalsi TaxID=475979 RepID=A0ABV8QBB7_9GAMM
MDMRTPSTLLNLLLSAQAKGDIAGEDATLQIVDDARFITDTSSCYAIARDLGLETADDFPKLTDALIKSLNDAGWNSQYLAVALTASQNEMVEVPVHSGESRSDYLNRLYDSRFNCNDIDEARLEEISTSIPQKPATTK